MKNAVLLGIAAGVVLGILTAAALLNIPKTRCYQCPPTCCAVKK